MSGRERAEESVSVDAAAATFQALGSPNRLDLLGQLDHQRTLDELKLTTQPSDGEQARARPLTRQGLLHHLDQLVEAGLVEVDRRKEDGRYRNVYRRVPAELFDAAEALHDLLLSPTRPQEGGRGASPAAEASGPRLVLVHGVPRGQRFRLDSGPEQGRWRIGRSESAEIRLAHDPLVAETHAEVRRTADALEVHALREVPAPAHVNWSPLGAGSTAPVTSGDVLGVGRSLLVVAGL